MRIYLSFRHENEDGPGPVAHGTGPSEPAADPVVQADAATAAG